MTQTGIVKKILDKGMADVAVERVTACSHCSGCGECIYGKEIHVEAENKIFAQPGERVVLESKTTTILGVTAEVHHRQRHCHRRRRHGLHGAGQTLQEDRLLHHRL